MANTQDFINQIAPLIVAEGKKRGYSVFSAVIAQAIIESNSGKSKLSQPPNFNFFGLKTGSAWDKAGKPFVAMKTKEEYVAGKLTTITAKFRKYGSMAEGVAGITSNSKKVIYCMVLIYYIIIDKISKNHWPVFE